MKENKSAGLLLKSKSRGGGRREGGEKAEETLGKSSDMLLRCR